MDTVTHTLIGVGLGNAFFRRRIGTPAVVILAVASNLPDVDAIVHFTGDAASILQRRTFGHSIFAFPLWALLLAAVFRWVYPRIPFKILYGLTLLGATVHIGYDLVNSFGVVLLWPLSDWRPELAWVFIIDLAITGLLLLPLILCLPRGMRPYLVPLSRIAVAGVLFYTLFCGGNRFLAQQNLAAETDRLGLQPEFVYVFPEVLGPHRWRGVVREDGTSRVFQIFSLSGKVVLKGEVETRDADPRVARVRTTDLARRLEWFFKAPVWEVVETEEGKGENPWTEVRVHDLRFRSLVIDRGEPFTFRFRVDADGGVSRLP
ncbi:MAG: metal-dependent hydrolase [Nitrospirae bacterium]|nr:metal-dependent hydrolase [Nitrospirota bacterium]